MSAAPRAVPSIWNCTLVTPTLSEAVAWMVVVPESVEPEAGDVRETWGTVVSGVVVGVVVAGGVIGGTIMTSLFVITGIETDVEFPAASRATAVRV